MKRIESKSGSCEACYYWKNNGCRSKGNVFPTKGSKACVEKVGKAKFKFYIWMKEND